MNQKPPTFYTDYYYQPDLLQPANERCACGNLKHRCTCKRVEKGQAQGMVEHAITPPAASTSMADARAQDEEFDPRRHIYVENGKVCRGDR